VNPAKHFLAVMALVLGFAAQAQPIRILVGFPPGGQVDIIGRVLAEPMSESLKRPVLVENRTGGSGRIAISALKDAAADGSTMVIMPASALTLFPLTVDKPPFGIEDFSFVAHTGSYDTGLGIGPHVPASDLASWIAWVKADKKAAIYGSPSAGSIQHFLGFMLGEQIGVPLEHISYNGVGPVVAGLLGGSLAAGVIPTAQLVTLAKSGKVRVLGVSSQQRIPAIPDAPTFKELGYPSLAVPAWYLLALPAGVRPDILTRYNEAANQALRTQAVRDRMRQQDIHIQERSPSQVTAELKAELEHWRPVVKRSGFKTGSGL
jgi:tripartite-type tricarboxylate transporter receptor subunit TctC